MDIGFGEVADALPGLVWTALPDGHVDYRNRGWWEYTGIAPDQRVGHEWQAAVHPDDLPGALAAWKAIAASGVSGDLEYRLRGRDGEYRRFLISARPLHDDAGRLVKWCGTGTDIEDLRRTQEQRILDLQKRKEVEEGFRAIVETTPECVKLVSREGTVLKVNQAGVAMAGAPSAEAVLGRCFYDFVAPEHRKRYVAFNERICAGGKGFLEFDLINAQGVRRHMETHAAALHASDGSLVQLGITRDITPRKQAEDQVRRSEALLSRTQQLTSSGSFLWNPDSGEITWSEEVYCIFGFDSTERVTLEMIRSRVYPDDRALVEDMIARGQASKNFEYEYRLLMPDGTVRHVHMQAQSIRDAQGRLEFVGAVQDVTDRRRSEETLGKLRAELAHVTRVNTLGALTASIAHEVNQPLAGIMTNASTCVRMLSAEPPNVKGALETAKRTIRDGGRASDVIARLRALFSKKDAITDALDLNEAAREVLALLRSEIRRNQVAVRMALADDLPQVCGDRVQLQQVVLNLVMNAVDAMSGVDDRPREVSIRTQRADDGNVWLAVSDTGPGFEPGVADKLFDAFFTTKTHGMGIGLSVSRSIIETHQGRLWATSNQGAGATFLFSIPPVSPPISGAGSMRAAGGAG